MTASRRLRGATGRAIGLIDGQRQPDADEHEQRNDPDHPVPCQMVREHERERAGNQSRDPERLNVNRVTEPEFEFREQFPPIRVEHDVLRRAEERNDHREPENRLKAGLWMPLAHQSDRREQAYLSDEHPAASAAQQRQLITIEQRGPRELPDVRQLDQRQQADLFEIDALAAQPTRHQLNQEEERQPGRKAGEGTDDDAAVRNPAQDGIGLLHRVADQSRKFSNCSGMSSSASRNIAITCWRSSRFLPVIRIFSPWIDAWTLSFESLTRFTMALPWSPSMP